MSGAGSQAIYTDVWASMDASGKRKAQKDFSSYS